MNNNTYQVIWNINLGEWVVASELAKRGKKRGSIRRNILAAPLLALYASISFALPTGNELVAGSASVSTPTAGHLQINQTSQNAIINWQGFSIGAHESVNIQQPNANSVQLDRVVGQDPSVIQGQLNANGQVYLINPNGVIFSKTAQVDVGGLVASTHSISNADFLNGKQHFTQDHANGSVINQGQITTAKGGIVALIGEQVTNTGSINTPQGTTVLAAGKTVDLDMQGSGLVEVKVTEAALNAQITNSGIIQADGGQVIMSAQSASQLLKTVINNEGVIEARGLVEKNGAIVLSGGDNGVVQVTGTLDVSGQSASPSANSNVEGGKIIVSGQQIALNNGAILNADSIQAGKQGSIQLLAQQDITLAAGSKISANNSQGDAGAIHIESKTGTTLAQGTIEAQARHVGKGGPIELLGERVGVVDQASINASGENGGGQVLIGGDYQGKKPVVHNAKATYVDKDTTIKADANTNGDGGKVIVWSDEATRAYGDISAKGGKQSGNGGFIETSGHWLDTAGIKINASSSHGLGGEWLLDPYDITIQGFSGPTTSGPSFPNWTAGATSSIIINTDIEAQLNNGTSVTIYTGGATGTDVGNITVAATNISKTLGGNATLDLKADNAIIIDSGIGISSTNNQLNVIFNADADGSGAGNIQMMNGSSISTNGGNIIMGGGSCSTVNCTLAASGYDATSQFKSNGIYFNGIGESIVTLNSGGGDISLQGQGINDALTGSAITHSGIYANYLNLNSGGGIINFQGDGGSGIDRNSGIVMQNVSLLSLGGTMTLTGTGAASATGFGNTGIDLYSSTLDSNIGTMILNGTGGGGADFNTGVYIGVDPRGLTASSLITTGTMNITGIGGSGTGTDNKGIGLSSAFLSAGSMNLTGTGGSGSDYNRGIFAVEYNSTLGGTQLTSTGNMTLTGTGGSSATASNNHGIALNAAALSSGAGTMTLSGYSQLAYGLSINTGSSIGNNKQSGAITLKADSTTGADSIFLASGATLTGTGNLYLLPVNTATTIGLAGGTGLFNLDTTELATFVNGFSNITIGNQSGAGQANIGAWTAPVSADLTIFGPGGITQTGAITLGSGKNLVLASAGNYTNTFGVGALNVSGGGRALIYAANPNSETKNGLTSAFRQYNTVYGGAIGGTGNGFIYASALGQLNINTILTSGAASNSYGIAPTAVFGYAIGNPTMADNEDLAAIGGSAVFTPTISASSSAGGYTVGYFNGLSSAVGYTFAAGVGLSYTVNPALLNVAAIATGKTYGSIDPALTYNATGFVNGDSSTVLTGALTRAAGETVAGSPYAISQGSLANSNYTISYTGANFTINPASLSISYAIIPPYIPQNPPPVTTVIPVDSLVNPAVQDVTNSFTGDYVLSVQDNERSVIKPTLKIKNSAGRVRRLELDTSKQYLSLLLEDGSVRIWDFQAGVQRKITTQDKNQALTDISPVNDKGESLSIANKAGLGTYDIIGSIIEDKFSINEPNARHFMTSNDGNLVLVNAGTSDLSLWDNKQNKKLWQIPYSRGEVNSLALTDNKRYAAVLSLQAGSYELSANSQLKPITDAVDIIDLGTGKVVKSLPNVGEQIIHMQFKNKDTLQLGLANGELQDWPIATDNLIHVASFAETISAVDVSKNTYAYILKDGTVRVGNGQGHIQLNIKNEENPFKYAKLVEGDKNLLTVMANGELSLWDVASGKKMLRLFSTQQGWTAMDAYGRFDGSEEALENFTWAANEENIPLDSFSENYYEPGLVSNVLHNQNYLNSNPFMVKEGITLPPKVALQMADQQAKGDNAGLQLDVFDRGGGIDKISVFQNGKLLNNEDVIASQQTLQNNNAEHRVLTLNVIPSAGKNTVKVIASNDMGIENGSTELSFDGKTKVSTSAIRMLTIGIDKYSDSSLNLDYSVADANAIGQALIKSSKIASNTSLYNENATKPKILAELKEVSHGNQQDTLIIYFAGHGMALGKEWYFLPYETKMQPTPEQIAATGITATELSEIFKDTKMQHILVMIDSCYSGAAADSFNKLQIGQHYITRNLSRSLGITMITSASKDKEAYELSSLGHGLFTYLMTQDIQKNDANHSAHGVAENIVKTLPAFSKKMVGAIQEPVIYTKGNNFMLTDLSKESNKGELNPAALSSPKELTQ